jgi:hypothetical protein
VFVQVATRSAMARRESAAVRSDTDLRGFQVMVAVLEPEDGDRELCGNVGDGI